MNGKDVLVYCQDMSFLGGVGGGKKSLKICKVSDKF